jgi:hypothetical protein
MSICILPPDVLLMLSPPEQRILDCFCKIWGYNARVRPSQKNICHPGEKYIAEKTGYSVSHISRAIKSLCGKMLLTAKQWRLRSGKWSTNYYNIGLIWRLYLSSESDLTGFLLRSRMLKRAKIASLKTLPILVNLLNAKLSTGNGLNHDQKCEGMP